MNKILFIKHVEIEGPETLGRFFADRGFAIDVCDLHAGGKLPPTLKDIVAVVSLGGPMNVYEEEKYPFLKDEDVFLKEVLRAKIPFLGICLGSQLLSKAAGGKVVRSPEEEIGWSHVDLLPAAKNDALLKGLPQHWEVYQWHGDMCQPPEGAVLLASSPACSVQAFRYGDHAWGLQFHAEITIKSIEEWSEDYAPEKQDQRKAMIDRYHQIKDIFHAQGDQLCANFLEVIKNRS